MRFMCLTDLYIFMQIAPLYDFMSEFAYACYLEIHIWNNHVQNKKILVFSWWKWKQYYRRKWRFEISSTSISSLRCNVHRIKNDHRKNALLVRNPFLSASCCSLTSSRLVLLSEWCYETRFLINNSNRMPLTRNSHVFCLNIAGNWRKFVPTITQRSTAMFL